MGSGSVGFRATPANLNAVAFLGGVVAWTGAAVLVFFSFAFPLGFFALGGCAFAWWYVRAGRYALSGGRITGRSRRARGIDRRMMAERRTTLNPLALYRRWRLKRQFTRLMRGSTPRDDETIH